MPTTWSAGKIHFLTQPELRALFRVITRKRDRALKAKGYEVLRYSGGEIHTDPVAAATDLAEYLWSIRGSIGQGAS